MRRYQTAAARILLGLVFFGVVILKLSAITNTPNGYLLYQDMLSRLGLIGIFAPLLILVQFVGGLAIIVGYKTRIAAIAMGVLATFTALMAAKASFAFSQPFDSFFLYMGIAGGMWMLSIYPQTAFSLDEKNK